MNATIGKSAKWYVRIIEPKIIRYEFKSKGGTVHAKKFECVLASKEPARYMLATALFCGGDEGGNWYQRDTFIICLSYPSHNNYSYWEGSVVVVVV